MKTTAALTLCLAFSGCSVMKAVIEGPQAGRDIATKNFRADWDACNSQAFAWADGFKNQDTALIQLQEEMRRCMASKGR